MSDKEIYIYAFVEYPSLSIINGFVNMFHAFGTFSNHSCRCWHGYQMDVTGKIPIFNRHFFVCNNNDFFSGMYLVILFPLCYNIVHIFLDRRCANHILLFQQSANKHMMDRAVIVMMVVYFFCAGLFFLTTYIPV